MFPMSLFKLHAPWPPTGDQPKAIGELVRGVQDGLSHQTLIGVTGSGKTFSIANVIAAVGWPTLVISHNKTLAAQLCQEFREFFPENAVEYFVSYYDYYQPEAYIPHTDTYLEKETDINEEIDKLRLSSTTSLLTRKDVIVVASVSCIYNLGSPKEYGRAILPLSTGKQIDRDVLLAKLLHLHYTRNDVALARSTFRVKGGVIDVHPGYLSYALRIVLLGDRIERLLYFDPVTGQHKHLVDTVCLYPAKHYITQKESLTPALETISSDLQIRVAQLSAEGKLLEAQRLKQRTQYDLEMIAEFGYCNGIENYSRYFDGRKPGEAPHCLLDYFPRDYLVVIDESHITLPQIRGMYAGDKSRKETLIEYGFRLPSALDNRPLTFDECMRRVGQVIYTSATPDEYELSLSQKKVEQLIRPTGLLDPEVHVRPTANQIDDLVDEITARVSRGERVLITTLTKAMAEDLAQYLHELSFKVHYLHSGINTLARSDILDALRMGEYDIVVGINLLREGLDLPEVSLVVILDAEREGFLRSTTSLIQTMGRAARHVRGTVCMYADTMTQSMQRAIEETRRRRAMQIAYNKKYGITPKGIEKGRRQRLVEKTNEGQEARMERVLTDPTQEIERLKIHMRKAADALDFEKAARFRDQIKHIERLVR